MRTMGLVEAKQNLVELVQRASEGESIGITRRGKLAAVISSPRSRSDLREVFDRERGELMTAASFPRRVIPMLSPSLARCTNSESFCLASNNPMVRIPPPIHLD